jgi:hypothetical protein
MSYHRASNLLVLLTSFQAVFYRLGVPPPWGKIFLKTDMVSKYYQEIDLFHGEERAITQRNSKPLSTLN